MFVSNSGDGGIGKTSSMGFVALDWAENSKQEITIFDFVFLISLRHVDGNQPLESVILQQHGRLKTEGVKISEIKTIIKGQQKILLLLDGYDEYTSGTNEEIDDLIANGKDNCLILLSSRPGDYLATVRTKMDEEVTISGFSYENIIKCAEQYLGSKQARREFLLQAEKASIHKSNDTRLSDMDDYEGLLHIPIILLMACTVFSERKCLPSSKTGLFKQVIQMCMSRTTLKTMGKTAGEVRDQNGYWRKSLKNA